MYLIDKTLGVVSSWDRRSPTEIKFEIGEVEVVFEVSEIEIMARAGKRHGSCYAFILRTPLQQRHEFPPQLGNDLFRWAAMGIAEVRESLEGKP